MILYIIYPVSFEIFYLLVIIMYVHMYFLVIENKFVFSFVRNDSTRKKSMQIIKIRYMWPSFKDFANKNFTSFIAMTLIIARKTITAVFGTMTLQLIEAFQCSVQWHSKGEGGKWGHAP